ncbi:sulfatase [Maribacter sp. 2307ULW6-5]|uniref:sulfatase family protein n=1 Tax=Maribacter sp. 2307ULW6-5 TaxID=3386275 RepID=UPI0039BD34B2
MKNYARLFFMSLLVLKAFGSCKKATKNNEAVAQKPNILFITTDYTRGADMDELSGILKMPTVKKLYDEGAVFTRHSSVSPICMPARASIVTGMYPHSHSLWDNRSISIKKPDRPFLMRDLQKLGYTTVGIGKMHFNPFGADYDFDVYQSLEGKDRDYRNDDYEKYLEEHGTSRKEIRKNHVDNGRPPGQDFYPWHIAEKLHPDYFVGEMAVETITDGAINKEKPWFMWVSFTGPHNPWNPPKRFFEDYPPAKMPDAKFMEGELKNKPIEYTRHRYGYGRDLLSIYDKLPGEEQEQFRKQVKAAHFASLGFVDEQIGRVMAALKDKNLLENTIVIFTSDHGSALFDNEMLHKGSPFPTQSLVPMLVWGPKYIVPGIRNGFTSHVDVYPTFIELAGGIASSKVEGESFFGSLKSDNHKTQDFVVIESAMVSSLMTYDLLLGFHHISKEIELYDLQKDPMCHYNVADVSDNTEVVNELKKTLVDWRREKSPDLQIGEDPLQWGLEILGDSVEMSKLKNSYLKAYERLAEIDELRPGILGGGALEVIGKIGYLVEP